MGLSDGLKDTFRDKYRDTVCNMLQTMGIDAQMAKRGRPEEDIESGPYYCKSLGIIDIAEGPIRWLNVIRKRLGHITEYYLKCGVPDSRLGPGSPKVQIETAPKLRFLIYGKVVGLKWEGEDSGLGLISRLNSDSLLKQMLIQSKVKVKISAYGNRGFWIISTDYSLFTYTPDYIPSEAEWSSCQSIASHLLADWSQDSNRISSSE